MKAIMLMFDSLNRHFLPPYGNEWVHAPNFTRLAERSITFDQCWVGSMPCMPARRELHTGRYNFLHRSWGPLEPYDDSMPELLKQAGVYTHLATDHQHYWEDGGGTYHTRYQTWEFFRGQEGDPWKGQVKNPTPPIMLGGHEGNSLVRQDWINRQFIREEKEFPQAMTIAAGLDFIERNRNEDNWFLQLETFDPHEPFFAPDVYRQLYPHTYNGPHFDWPSYRRTTETLEQVDHIRYEYAALVSMCDAYLGKVLDAMDRYDLWNDTMLIVNTDHGFLLGEHGWWAKCVQPFYNEVARMPLFIWDPRSGRKGERSQSLVQGIDLPATLLEFFRVPLPPDMQGVPLSGVMNGVELEREAILFGIFGGHVNVTDGRYVYMRAASHSRNSPLFEYTLMPTHMRTRFSVEEFKGMELAPAFSFTKQTPLLKIKGRGWSLLNPFETMLFDLYTDPEQQNPLEDETVERRMCRLLIEFMDRNDAPSEQYLRLGLQESRTGVEHG